MPAFSVSSDDLASIRQWFAGFGARVAEVDFGGGREYFAEDAVGFGTFMDVVEGREELIRTQWRSVWPTIEDFRFNLEKLHADISADGLLAVAVLTWDSTGIAGDGSRFPRGGRATLALRRADLTAPWRATHSHLSLNRGVPQQSHGSRPEKA